MWAKGRRAFLRSKVLSLGFSRSVSLPPVSLCFSLCFLCLSPLSPRLESFFCWSSSASAQSLLGLVKHAVCGSVVSRRDGKPETVLRQFDNLLIYL